MFAFILMIDCPIESLKYSIEFWLIKKSFHPEMLGPNSQTLGKKYDLQKKLLKTMFDLRVKTIMKSQ